MNRLTFSFVDQSQIFSLIGKAEVGVQGILIRRSIFSRCKDDKKGSRCQGLLGKGPLRGVCPIIRESKILKINDV